LLPAVAVMQVVQVVQVVQVSYNEALAKVVSGGSPPPESLPRPKRGVGFGSEHSDRSRKTIYKKRAVFQP